MHASAGSDKVLFYTGFDGGNRDAQAIGDGKVRLIDGGGALTADGFDSVRGSALRSGDDHQKQNTVWEKDRSAESDNIHTLEVVKRDNYE